MGLGREDVRLGARGTTTENDTLAFESLKTARHSDH